MKLILNNFARRISVLDKIVDFFGDIFIPGFSPWRKAQLIVIGFVFFIIGLVWFSNYMDSRNSHDKQEIIIVKKPIENVLYNITLAQLSYKSKNEKYAKSVSELCTTNLIFEKSLKEIKKDGDSAIVHGYEITQIFCKDNDYEISAKPIKGGKTFKITEETILNRR